MTVPINNSFYADPQGLAALRTDAKAQDPAALEEAARQFESLFTQMLLKSMREASKSTGDSMFESDQTDFYQGMFDDQMAMHLSQGRGLGLADMLVQQLSQSRQAPTVAARTLTAPSSTMQPTAGAAPVAGSKQEFLRSMWPHAEQAAQEIGVDPHALLAQAALETGWGRSVPSNAAGASGCNLFGIKAGADWSGATTNVPTLEFEDGVAVRKVERFRAYESAADSFRDYARLIRSNPRYQDALNTGADVASFAAALQQGGYATDPNYASKVVALANQMRALAQGPARVSSFKFVDATPLAAGGGV